MSYTVTKVNVIFNDKQLIKEGHTYKLTSNFTEYNVKRKDYFSGSSLNKTK